MSQAREVHRPYVIILICKTFKKDGILHYQNNNNKVGRTIGPQLIERIVVNEGHCC